MSYHDFETSRDKSAPIECYQFKSGDGKVWNYTSSDTKVSLSGNEYIPSVVKRGDIRVSSNRGNEVELRVEIETSSEIVKIFAYSQAPPQNLTLELFRLFDTGTGDTSFKKIWSGSVQSITLKQYMAELIVTNPVGKILHADMPSVYWQRGCNHVLYDKRCGVNADTFTWQGKISNLSGTAITLEPSQVNLNNLIAGEIILDNNGERRGISSVKDDTLNISFPFSEANAGDSVTLRAGCDHSLKTCGSVFNNVKNYGGFPTIPEENPFIGEIE